MKLVYVQSTIHQDIRYRFMIGGYFNANTPIEDRELQLQKENNFFML